MIHILNSKLILKKKCFLYDKNHKIKNCDLFKKFKKFVKHEKKIKNKNVKFKQKIYNVENFKFNNVNNFKFFNINSNNDKNMKKIVVLFKKIINKIVFKFC